MVFVDSNVWIAYFNKNDKFHPNAIKSFSKIKTFETVYISSGIVFEVVNYLFKIYGKIESRRVLDFFLTNSAIEIVFISRIAWDKTVNLFKENELSLTDAQIVACMFENKDTEIYSFDKHFDKINGIKRIY
jgi:predicted nucleic acid-binding protein